MSLQDDIFDVRDALEGKPEKEAFARIEERFNEAEVAADRAMTLYRAIQTIKQAWETL